MYLRAAMGDRCSHRSIGEHRSYKTVPAWQQRSHQGDKLAVTDKRRFTTRCEGLALFSCFGVCALCCQEGGSRHVLQRREVCICFRLELVWHCAIIVLQK